MAIELASALLIVGGIFSTISAVAFIASGGAAPLGPVYALVLALDLLTVVVGFLIRSLLSGARYRHAPAKTASRSGRAFATGVG